MAGTAKTRAALKAQSDASFPSGTGAIVAIEHRQFNEDADASALNIEDPDPQEVTSEVTFAQAIEAYAVDFALGTPDVYKIGRIIYDEVENTHTAYNDLEGVSLQIGEELRARLTNDTGATLLDGVAVAIVGAVGANLKVELLDASRICCAIRAIGMVTLTAVSGADSYITRFGKVRNLNTAAFSPGDVLYADPATPGGLINTRPDAPFYPVRMGFCIISDAVNGVLGIDTLAFSGTDTAVNIEGTLNGVVVETPLVEFYESAGFIYAEITNQNAPSRDLAFILDGVRYLLNTTTGGGPNGGAFAALTLGADAETLFENFIYIWLNGVTPEFKVGTLATPDVNAPIGKVALFDHTRTVAEGVYEWRRYNDAPDNGADDGFNRWAMDAVRDKLGTTYTSGIDGTPAVDSTPSVKLPTTAGQAMQAHVGAFTAQDGSSYWIYNDNANAVVYEFTDDLASIIETATGESLAVNGAYYRLRVYGMQNSLAGGALAPPDKLIVTRPLGFYSTAAEAITDAANLDVAPNDIITEGVLFRLYTLVIGRTGGGGAAWALIELQNNRTRLVGKGAGGGGATAGGGTDDKVRVSATDTTNSYLNDKIVAGSGLNKSTLNPGGNEQIELAAVPNFKAEAIKTLSSGVAASGIDRNLLIAAESGVIDDMIELTGLDVGDKVQLRADVGDTITVKHDDAGAAIKILLQDDADVDLDEVHPLELTLSSANALVQSFRKASGGSGAEEKELQFSSNLDTVRETTFNGLLTVTALVLTAGLTSVSYEVSDDDGATYAPVADLAALNAWIVANITGDASTGTKWRLRTMADFGATINLQSLTVIFTR